jgi:hypothetical protein
MRLTSTGLGIGTSSPGTKLDVQVSGGRFQVYPAVTATGVRLLSVNTGNSAAVPMEISGTDIRFTNSSNTLNAILDSSGNLGLGVTPSGWDGTVGGAFVFGSTGKGSLSYAGGATTLGDNFYRSSSGFRYTTTAAVSLYQATAGQHIWYNAPSGTAGNAISFTQAMTLDASGNLIVGGTSASGKAEIVSSGSQSTLVLRNSTSGAASYSEILFAPFTGTTAAAASIRNIYSTNDSSQLTFATTNTNATPQERMRLDNVGNLLVGTTSLPDGTQNAAALRGTADACLFLSRNSTAAATQAAFFNPNGVVGRIETSGSTTTFATSSDYRLKNTIAPMTGALSKVALLKPCTYKWNVDGADGEGFIAHELAEVVPQCVIGEKDAVDAKGKPVYQGIDTSFLVATLTAAIQELKAEFDAYKSTHP